LPDLTIEKNKIDVTYLVFFVDYCWVERDRRLSKRNERQTSKTVNKLDITREYK